MVTSALNHGTLFVKFGSVCSERSERANKLEAELWSVRLKMYTTKHMSSITPSRVAVY